MIKGLTALWPAVLAALLIGVFTGQFGDRPVSGEWVSGRSFSGAGHGRRSEEDNLPVTDLAFFGDSHIQFFDWQARYPSETAGQFGVAGETVAAISARLGDVTAARPRWLFIAAGTNDLMLGYMAARPLPELLAEMRAGYEALFRAVAEQLPYTEVAVSGIPPAIVRFASASYLEEANRMLEEIALQSGFRFIDLYSMLAGGDGAATEQYSSDGLHLSEAGYEVWLCEIGRLRGEAVLRENRYLHVGRS